MTEEQTERLVKAVESISQSLTLFALLAKESFDREYPPKKETVDSTVTHIKTEEEILREQQGGEDIFEPIDEWMGPRELELLNKEKGEKL